MHCRANCICGRERPAANVVFLSALIKFAGQWHVLLSAVRVRLACQIHPTHRHYHPSPWHKLPQLCCPHPDPMFRSVGASLSGEEANLAVSGRNADFGKAADVDLDCLPPFPFTITPGTWTHALTPFLSFELWRQFPVGFGATNGMEAR